jgi:hypothetical protein
MPTSDIISLSSIVVDVTLEDSIDPEGEGGDPPFVD